MVRVGVVGCGTIMQEHYQRLRALGDQVEIVGHCDIDEAAAEAAAQAFGGRAYQQPEQLYDDAKPEAVYVAVPPFARGKIEIAAAERGVHLFLEKPAALDKAAARQVQAAVRKAKVLTSVGYCYRYLDTVTYARQKLRGKVICLVRGCWKGGMPQTWWWRRRDKSGGQLVEQTTHLFDLVRYLCGEIAEVYGVAGNGCMSKVDGYDIDDSSAVAFRLKNGASGSIVSTCAVDHDNHTELEVLTPDLTLRLHGGILTLKEDHVISELRPRVNMYEEETRAFIEAVTNGKRGRIRSTYADAVKTLQVTAAANESILSGMPARP